ncbi:FliH/SctL family protein [Candidatus Allofournierella merdavium]|uniref:FliH/SctL family protein n=1 Tax=Candidatus Allofournierella merdavium TaxID=2838593 RepID=UPI00374F7FD1
MPNIFKNFLRPQVDTYAFPPADEIQVEEEPASPPPQEAPPEDEQPAAKEQPDGETSDSDPGQGAAAMFSYARVQADAIVAEARRQSEEILEEARRQARLEAEEIQEDARQQGFRQGYEDGQRKAQVEGQARLEEQMQQQAVQVKDFLEQATQAREDLLASTQDELCDLSIAVAEKVIHVSLKSSREVILRMVQMATERLRRRDWVRIYIGGCDSRELAQITPKLMASLGGLSDNIKLIPMANDESGTCIIEMPDEIIDASASTQLGNLKDILHGS